MDDGDLFCLKCDRDNRKPLLDSQLPGEEAPGDETGMKKEKPMVWYGVEKNLSPERVRGG